MAATNKEKLDALVAKGVDLKAAGLTSRSKTSDIDAVVKKNGVVIGDEEGDDSNAENISNIEKAAKPLTIEERLTAVEEMLSKVVAVPAIAQQLTLGHISAPPVATPRAVAVPKAKAKSSITFTTTSKANPTRTFSKEEHGADFNDVANEFHKTNASTIISRDHDDESATVA